MSRLAQHLAEGAELLTRVMADQALLSEVDKAGDILVNCLKAGGKILSAGNGGSHCDAMHFAEELSGRYRDNRPALGALAISDPSHITCVGNDYGFEFIFSRQVEALGRAGDVFFGISTSGCIPYTQAAWTHARFLCDHELDFLHSQIQIKEKKSSPSLNLGRA